MTGSDACSNMQRGHKRLGQKLAWTTSVLRSCRSCCRGAARGNMARALGVWFQKRKGRQRVVSAHRSPKRQVEISLAKKK
jgi:hypothetical protein